MFLLRSWILVIFSLFTASAFSQRTHHYVAAVQGFGMNAQEKELLHILRTGDPSGRFVIDAGTGDVEIHTTSLLSETAFGNVVNSAGLVLLHFQEVRPEAAPRRRMNMRSA